MPVAYPLFAIVAVSAIYTLPALVAVSLGRRHQWGVLALNVVAGWTVVGWLLSMRWALAKSRTPRPKSGRLRRAPFSVVDKGSERVHERAAFDASWADAPGAPDAYTQWLETGAVQRDDAASQAPAKTLPLEPSPRFLPKAHRRPTGQFAPRSAAA